MNKRRAKIAIDFLMIVSLPMLMAYSLIGEGFHEVLGVVMGGLFIAHNVLNAWWYRSLAKMRRTALGRLMIVVDLALVVDILLLMASGIVLSTFVFAFVDVEAFYDVARLVHLCASHWGFLLMSFHAGTHFSLERILFMERKATGKNEADGQTSGQRNTAKVGLIAGLCLVCAFGVFAFFKNNFLDCLFLRTHFVFLDFESPRIFFFAQYISMIVLFGTLGAMGKRLCKK